MKIIPIKYNPELVSKAIAFFQKCWADDNSKMVYENCISNSLDLLNPLPQWYLLMEGDLIIGGAGLVTNDFISRMDLYPWFVALFIEEEYRGNQYGSLLLQKAQEDAQKAGFKHLYLSTKLNGFYEKYGFDYIDDGYHPWGEKSRIYKSV
jgi:N-acetylglutamate synthase-like GNAT family acetyltransferase